MPLTLSADLLRAVEIMRAHRGPWGIAGGWAIDLLVGTSTRPHADVDVAVLRDDQDALRRTLVDASVDKMVNGVRVPWLAGGSSRRYTSCMHGGPTARTSSSC